jgi:hypothetical protein
MGGGCGVRLLEEKIGEPNVLTCLDRVEAVLYHRLGERLCLPPRSRSAEAHRVAHYSMEGVPVSAGGRRNVESGLWIVAVLVLLVLLTGSCGRLQHRAPRSTSFHTLESQSSSSFVLHNAIFTPRSAGGFVRTALPVPAGAAIAAPLSGGTSPVAELSADGRTLVYNTWENLVPPPGPAQTPPPTGTLMAHPSIRVFDLQSGVDTLFADGAISPVISSTGDVAFVAGDRPDYYQNEPFTGTIMVRSLQDPKATTLVGTPQNYRPVGWAGSTLLYYVEGEGEALDLYSAGIGATPRLLATDVGVVAISPDESSVLVQRLGSGEGDVMLLDVSSGAVLQHASALTTPAGTPTGALELNGDWLGNQVVAGGTTFSGLIYLTVDSEGIRAERIEDLGTDALPWGVANPRFSADGTSVTAFAVIPATSKSASAHSFAKVVTCYGSSTTCTSVAPEPGQAGAASPLVQAR